MKGADVTTCEDCNKTIFRTVIGERDFSFEDLSCKKPHTKLRCEINQILDTKLNHFEIELNQIKQRLNLE